MANVKKCYRKQNRENTEWSSGFLPLLIEKELGAICEYNTEMKGLKTMTQRPIFLPASSDSELVEILLIDFTWYSGFAKSQYQKSIASLHESAHEETISPILEISSKSPDNLGVSLSAFNLEIEIEGEGTFAVEKLYQGSKVFVNGGPYADLYKADSSKAKTDDRLKNSGDLTHYDLFGDRWDSTPRTTFYDWLYLTALGQNPNLSNQLVQYAGFTDIHFNHNTSSVCQARSAALYVTLSRRGLLADAMNDRQSLIDLLESDT